MGRKLLISAAALVCAVMPALAYSQVQSSATITATDPYAWSPTTVTVTAPATVTFEYPPGGGFNGHNVVWEGTAPPCDGSIPGDGVYGRRGWKGTCTFTAPGTYRFECKIHDGLMKGSVVVQAAPEPSASPTPTGTPTSTPEPTTTQPSTQIEQTVAPLSAKVASTQKGTSVRGSVVIAVPASRLEITVTAGKRRVGHYLKNAAASGTKRFVVKARPGKLKVTIAVTPRGGGSVQQRTFNVTLRR